MQYFQNLSFIAEIIFLLGCVAFLILASFDIITNGNSWLHSPKIYLRVIDFMGRIFLLVIAGYITFYSLVPRVIDIPALVTGDYKFLKGYATVSHGGGKDPYDYVEIDGTQVKFFMRLGISDGHYKVAFLPHSQRGIFIERVDQSLSSPQRKVKVPIDVIAFILYFFVIVFLLNGFAYWVLGIAGLIFYPVHLYKYVHYGIAGGTWFSTKNEAVAPLLLGLGLLLMLGLFRLFEGYIDRRKAEQYLWNYDEGQSMYWTKQIAHLVAFVYWLSILDTFHVL